MLLHLIESLFVWDIGYLNNPEATTYTIDKDGWLHTGDVGFVDDDDEVFIVDRVKEIIKYKGFQVLDTLLLMSIKYGLQFVEEDAK